MSYRALIFGIVLLLGGIVISNQVLHVREIPAKSFLGFLCILGGVLPGLLYLQYKHVGAISIGPFVVAGLTLVLYWLLSAVFGITSSAMQLVALLACAWLASFLVEGLQRRGRNIPPLCLAVLAALGVHSQPVATAAEPPRPNVLLILCDNLGYGDIGCYGSTRNRTPNLDRMAAEGMRFTHFYVSSGVCTPSRASFMTGCYPRRVNLHRSSYGGAVLIPRDKKGLHPDEVTVAEVLKSAGYATACIGKWHLGDQPTFLPTRQGFDHFFGIPYSDDMTARDDKRTGRWPELPLMRGEMVIGAPADRTTLTRRYTEEAIRFITAHRDRPWFVYLPQAMPGSTKTSFASEAFRGRSANGTYGDAIEELDWSTGELLAAIRRLGLDQKTLVIWTSDNGAVDREHGSNRPLAGWGYTTAEGAMRVPCLARWPGHVPAGATCKELATSMDLLPTLAGLAGGALPTRVIDGLDIRPLLLGMAGAKSPHDAFYYYYLDQLQAVRSGPWKLYLPVSNRWRNFRGEGKPAAAELYDVAADPGETANRAGEHPEVVQRLTVLAQRAREDMGDANRPGKGQRAAGWVENPQPREMPGPK